MAVGRKKGTPKTGGRKKGTPNRSTAAAAEILDRLKCDPIEGMARIAMNSRHPIELRARMYEALAKYRYPALKAVEHRATDDKGNTISLIDLLAAYHEAGRK